MVSVSPEGHTVWSQIRPKAPNLTDTPNTPKKNQRKVLQNEKGGGRETVHSKYCVYINKR